MRSRARYVRFRFDHRGYERFATSDEAREPAMSVARLIAADIASDPTVPRDSGDYARSFRVEPGEGTLEFGLGWRHSYAVVRSDHVVAPQFEFGNVGKNGSPAHEPLHVLRRAGARYHQPLKGAR